LRIFLDPQEAETASGDLIEAYRDSICPQRGRWHADVWYVRQVFSYVLRARGTPLRNWLSVGLALCVLTIGFSLLMYPGLLPGSFAAIVVAGLLFYSFAAAFRTRPVTSEDKVVLQFGTQYGVAIGALCIAGYVDDYTRVLGVGFLLGILAIALPFVAGAHAAIRLWRVRAGMRVGFWSGLIGGVIIFVWMMLMEYAGALIIGLPGAEIPSNPAYAAVEYQRANMIDTLRGGLIHLFLFGGVFSVIFGTVGGLAGILAARTGRGPDEPSRIRWSYEDPDEIRAHNCQQNSRGLWWLLISAGMLALFLAVFVGVRRHIETRPTSAASIPEPALQTAPEYLARGDEYFDRRDYAGALSDYSRALEMNPNFAEAYNNRAYAYMMLTNYASALPDLDAAIRLRPNYVNALMKRGDIHNFYYQVDRKLAIADYDRIIALGPAAYSRTSVCGHRLVAQHNGMSAGLWFSVVLSGRMATAGCVE
jgi:tetratricopeptide (TPR) repeat protein